ncbi:hypothetical protein [Psychrobacillus sp. BL-248-WT-3]|uniref:hypothetical protein n=1 Tax=Psychrobacillus sp. BL-248-WT-3 TaxID=2725306 RepID=UPI00146A94F1|nr:hypothetical protein [Psychrobacillus sp. BL-248-WT-3]NME06412.1 hypothetical protein [Psychrobacillus sp. BL-248-WT-3]
MELDIKKSATAYPCPDRQMCKCEEAAPRHRSFYPFDPEGQGGGARQQEKHNRLSLPRQANGKSEEAVLQPPELFSI